ncbi:hypothetical protein P153DRAFT_136607 [Dothidotthia symphoricarpi CBS 119687]|uniref:Uncharacterized protein n=1 Tax=Dothidotthia symphoricarpi CBS 119687 TaxID=1392245 RepID=A0A6A5ZWP2_9PLEO|nr:uncharacterized protein P153DRAFT_136607 [Dothidotthia symphoricarpi CBS 119687]KAF2124172.1 hypothetical protein P153DRAFT_136607 [Dothidotthia symphoricarpi CBS 119687]
MLTDTIAVLTYLDTTRGDRYALPVHDINAASPPKTRAASSSPSKVASTEHSPHTSAKRDSLERPAFEWPEWMSHFNPNSPRDPPGGYYKPNIFSRLRRAQEQPAVVKEPGEPQGLVVEENESSERVEVANPTHDSAFLVDVLATEPLQAPSSVSAPVFAPLAEPFQAPPSAPPPVFVQATVVAQAPVPAPTPSPELMLASVFQNLENGADVLQLAMLLFLSLVSLDDYHSSAESIANWIDNAYQALLPFFPHGLPSGASSEISWISWFKQFWDEIQPMGYLFQAHHDSRLMTFYRGVLTFGLYLGLTLEAPNFTPPAPPPPPPPMMQLPPALSIQHEQVVAETVHDAPQARSTPSLVSDFNTSKARQHQKSNQIVHRPQGVRKSTSARVLVALPASAPEKEAEPVSVPIQAAATISRQAPVQPDDELPPMPTSFEDDDEISEMSADTLKGLTPKSFGWVGDDQVGEMLWGKGSFKGYDLLLRGDENSWTRKSVEKQLKDMALLFKRATIVLFLQANTEFCQFHSEPARLVTNVKHFVTKAGRMTKHCGADASAVATWSPWIEACEFFHQSLRANSEIQTRLRKNFGIDGYTWESLEERWDEYKPLWVSDLMDPEEALAFMNADE